MPDAADMLAAMIRARVADWTEDHPVDGFWVWTNPDTELADPPEVILEGRVRRVRPISDRHLGQGVTFGPTVSAFANGVAVQVELPPMVDRSDLATALDVLAAAHVLPREAPDVH